MPNRCLCRRIFFAAIVVFLLCVTPIFGENDTFRSIYLNQPASLNECLDITKDHDGFMWVATSEGLTRYDGHAAKRYQFEYNFQRTLHALSDGSLVVINEFQSLNALRYNALRDRFDDICEPIDGLDDNVIVECSAVNDNNLWVGTSHGVVCYDGAACRWYRFEELCNSEIRSIVALGDKIAFLDVNNILSIAAVDFNTCALDIEQSVELSLKEAPVTAVYDPYLRAIHYGTNDDGLYTYSLVSGELVKHDNLGLDHMPIKALTDFDERYLLVGTDGLGVFKVRREDFSVAEHYCYRDQFDFSIASNAIYDLYVDSHKRIYAATYANGLCVLDAMSLNHQLIVPRGKHGEIVPSTVNALYEDSDGSLWMGTNLGIYTCTAEGRPSEVYTFERSVKSRNKVILTIKECGGEIYAGGYGSGLLHINRQRRLLQSVDIAHEHYSNFLFALYSDSDDELWMGGIDSKLMSMHPKEGRVTPYGDIYGVSSIADYSATKLIFSADYRPYIIDKVSREVAPFEFDSTFLASLRSVPRVHIIRRNNDIIYFATNNCGLLSYNITTGRFTSYASMLGADYRNILAFEVDKKGDVWLTTSSGVAYLNMQEHYAKCYERLGRVSAGSFIKGASLLTRGGKVLFGTLEGVLSIDPYIYNLDGEESLAPRLVDLKISYNSVLKDPALIDLDRPISDVERLCLSYTQNTFSLNFTHIDFSSYETSPYSWRLKGFDEQWSPISPRRYAEYRNVPPGEYEFQYRVYPSQSSGDYIQSSVMIDVLDPWYWSWYTITLYVMLLAAVIAGATHLYWQRMEQQQTQQKIDSYINFLHSLHTPISLIKAPMECLAREAGISSSMAHLVAVVSKNVDRLHALISRQTDFKSIMEEELSFHELSLNDYFRELSDNFWEYALVNNITLTLDSKQPNKLVCISREALDKIMDNLLSNAIKYSDRGGVVAIVTDYSASQWSVQITNQGVVIPAGEHKRLFKQPYRADNVVNAEQPSSGMGLVLSDRLVKKMGGSITFVSSESRGTIFTVRFPINNSCEEKCPECDCLEANIEPLEESQLPLYLEVEQAGDAREPEELSEADEQFVEQVNHIIRENLANQSFTIDTLCSDLFMSRSVFYNKMKHITNLTPNEMLRKARMEAAAELLASGNHSVQVVSDMVGFSDAKYFSKVFYRYYNCAPSKYPLEK